MREKILAAERKPISYNTELSFTFVRHSQKKSGEVYVGDAISTSSISEGGITRARSWGKEQLSGRGVKKGYATCSDRTRETLAAAFESAGINSKILQNSEAVNAFFSFPGSSESASITEEYDRRFKEERLRIMKERYPDHDFGALSPDQQEEIAEIAEEPVVDWYLNYCEVRRDDKTSTTREHAAAIAFKINRLINLTDFMPSGTSVDLVSCGHKTSTEAFLKYTIIHDQVSKSKIGFDSLKEIGGSLKILDSWDLNVKNDGDGNKTVSLTIRRENGDIQQYGLDINSIKQLALEHIVASNITKRKIDN